MCHKTKTMNSKRLKSSVQSCDNLLNNLLHFFVSSPSVASFFCPLSRQQILQQIRGDKNLLLFVVRAADSSISNCVVARPDYCRFQKDTKRELGTLIYLFVLALMMINDESQRHRACMLAKLLAGHRFY